MSTIKCNKCGGNNDYTANHCIYCGCLISGKDSVAITSTIEQVVNSETIQDEQTKSFPDKTNTIYSNNLSVNCTSGNTRKSKKLGLIIASATSVLLVAGVITFLQRGHFAKIIRVEDDTVYLTTGDDTTIEYEVYPEFADQGIEFSSDNEIISVNEQGIIEASGEGSAEITISAPNGKTATVTVCSSKLFKGMSFDSLLDLSTDEFIYGSDFSNVGYDKPTMQFTNDKFELTFLGDTYHGTWTLSNKDFVEGDDKGYDLIFDEGIHASAVMTNDFGNGNKDYLLLYLDLDEIELCLVFMINS